MHVDTIETLNAGVVLVTPSRRLSGLLADRYSAAMLEAGRESWTAPRVMPLAAWLSDSFQRLGQGGAAAPTGTLLLSVDQELALWEQVVAADPDIDRARTEALARLAADAWATVMLWALPYPLRPGAGARQEVRAFSRWCGRFERLCREYDAIDPHRFMTQLADEQTHREAIADGLLPEFRFFGFPRLPTGLARIADRWGCGQAEPLRMRTAIPPAAFAIRAYASAAMETEAAAAWARSEKERDPAGRIVLAFAGARRSERKALQRLERAFAFSDHDPHTFVLNTPENVPLAELAIVENALLLLDLRPVRQWQDVSRLLRSPYWGGALAERGRRALLDLALRKNGSVELAMDTVIEGARHGDCPQLVERLEALRHLAAALPRRQRMHEWMQFAETLLNAAGWPGEQELDPTERAALTEWQRLMDSVAALDAVVPPCSWTAALAKWRAMLRRRRFVPRRPVDSVAVVSLDEARFLAPDKLWVAGLNDGAWPEQSNVNPLLPIALQRECGVPGTDPVADLDHATDAVRCLTETHPTAIWSFAAIEDDLPRRAFTGAEVVSIPAAPLVAWPRSDLQFETFDDRMAGPHAGTGCLRGGVALFTDQAACPFRAFAKYRLLATTPEDPSPGLNALQRGTLVHDVMAGFWRVMQTSARLAGSSQDDVEALLESCADDAIARLRRRCRMPDPYWILERERLVELGAEWLAVELGRGEFEVIGCEQAGEATIGGLEIQTRIDRIDRLADGDLAIIDYKTGEVKASSWDVPRPDEPQLPLYAVAESGAAIGAVAYARIKKGKCAIVDQPAGRTSGKALDDETRAAWRRRVDDWAAALNALSDEISSGFALADPKHGARTCRYCDLPSLCRVYEPPQSDDEGEEP